MAQLLLGVPYHAIIAVELQGGQMHAAITVIEDFGPDHIVWTESPSTKRWVAARSAVVAVQVRDGVQLDPPQPPEPFFAFT